MHQRSSLTFSCCLLQATSTGTTIVGCLFDGGIVIGADTRVSSPGSAVELFFLSEPSKLTRTYSTTLQATEGPIVADKNCEKVRRSERMACEALRGEEGSPSCFLTDSLHLRVDSLRRCWNCCAYRLRCSAILDELELTTPFDLFPFLLVSDRLPLHCPTRYRLSPTPSPHTRCASVLSLIGRHRVHHRSDQLQHCPPRPLDRQEAHGRHCHDDAEADALPVSLSAAVSDVRRSLISSTFFSLSFLPIHLFRPHSSSSTSLLTLPFQTCHQPDTKAKSARPSSSAASTPRVPTSIPSPRTVRPTSSPT